MATKKQLTPSELVVSHIPKNFKYRYIITDPKFLDTLIEEEFDMSLLDTIKDDSLVVAAMNSDFVEYERTIVGKAKEPSVINEKVIISKKMVTKADKKLLKLLVGYFDHNGLYYVAIKLHYEHFDIIEIFVIV